MMFVREVRNAKEVAERSGNGVKLYYNVKENAVYTDYADGRIYTTTFLRKNTEEEIVSIVNHLLRM